MPRGPKGEKRPADANQRGVIAGSAASPCRFNRHGVDG